MPDLAKKLESLSRKDAIRALGLLYDISPADAWEGGVKPPVARIETICRRIRDEAPEETQPLVDGLFATDNVGARGELARYVLGRYAAEPLMAPYVEQAIDLAEKPDMCDPVTLLAIVAFMVLASPEVKRKERKTKTGTESEIVVTSGLIATIRALHVDKIAEQLPEIVKAIPESILDHFAGIPTGK